jgi:hypothetical protein
LYALHKTSIQETDAADSRKRGREAEKYSRVYSLGKMEVRKKGKIVYIVIYLGVKNARGGGSVVHAELFVPDWIWRLR